MRAKIVDFSCPKCSECLDIRKNDQDDSKYICCSNYPDCDYTEPIKRDKSKKNFLDEYLKTLN